MHRLLAYGIYRGTQALRREPVLEALRSLERSQWLSAEEVRSLQREKTEALLRHIVRHVPFYRDWLRETGKRADEFDSAAAFAELPIVGKEEVRERASRLLDSDRSYRYSKDSTSGSSGPSTIVYTDYAALAGQHAAVYRAYGWYGVRIGDPSVRFWGVQLDRHRRAKDRLKDRALNRVTFSTHDLSAAAMRRYAEAAARRRPVFIYGFTSAVADFAAFLQREGGMPASHGLKAVIVTGERCSPEQEALMREVFGAPVCNEYGCAEVGPIAFTCPEGAMHINAENVLVEIEPQWADADGTQFGEAIVTELNSRYMALARYRLGDIVGLSPARCRCGRGLPVLHSVSGRATDVVVTPEGGRVHGMFFEYLPKYFLGEIRRFQIVQQSVESLEVNVVKDEGFSGDTLPRFEGMLRETLGGVIGIRFHLVESIARERTGKQRFVRSEVKG